MAKPSKPKATGKNVALWDDELAKYAQAAQEREKSSMGGGNVITLQGGNFHYKGADIAEDTLNLVVLDTAFVNAMYGDYDPDDPQPPICYAVGNGGDITKNDDLIPAEDVTDKQHDSCNGCPNNEWGSAEKGRGKACKNTRRLAVISEDDLEDIENAEIAYIQLPVTSVKNWSGYVDRLARSAKRPPFAVVTAVSIVDDKATQFKLEFAKESDLERPQVEAIMERLQQVREDILFGYQKADPERLTSKKANTPKKGGCAPRRKY